MATRIIFTLGSVLILFLCSACRSSTPSPAMPSTIPSPTTPPTAASPTATPTAAIHATGIMLPKGSPPAIDGTITPGEWDGAHVETFADGSELFLYSDADYLYLAIRSSTPEMIAGNVLIANDEEIAILHTSAALGTGRYQKGTAAWKLNQPFVWRCRDYSQSQAAIAERAAFLEQEGWLASNSRAGAPQELEYQIKLSGSSLVLAVNFIKTSDTNTKIVWPVGLDDSTIQPTPGELPDEMQFSPDLWAVIQIPG